MEQYYNREGVCIRKARKEKDIDVISFGEKAQEILVKHGLLKKQYPVDFSANVISHAYAGVFCVRCHKTNKADMTLLLPNNFIMDSTEEALETENNFLMSVQRFLPCSVQILPLFAWSILHEIGHIKDYEDDSVPDRDPFGEMFSENRIESNNSYYNLKIERSATQNATRFAMHKGVFSDLCKLVEDTKNIANLDHMLDYQAIHKYIGKELEFVHQYRNKENRF